VPIFITLLLVIGTACGGGDESNTSGSASPKPTGAQADDAELDTGFNVYVSNCARCHGVKGEGGVGVQLSDGRAARRFPNIDDQIAVITGGRNLMPAFAGDLTRAQIRAVARYEREVL
jgi:mono/diheme cytochrome c family protein